MLGTDAFGRDVFVRAMLAGRLSLAVGVLGSIAAGLAGTLVGAIAAWRGGWTDRAAMGTAVRVVGDGVVQFAGEQNGFGNVVIVKHNSTDETVYAHLSRIDVRPGQNIAQGQNVGAVGMTGWATGPHLHFEFRVGGRHMDPRAIAKASEAITLPSYAKLQFQQTVASVKTQLAVAQTMDGVSAAE